MKCHEAAALINTKGLEEAIKVIGDPKGPFVWKDSYVFLMNFDGKMLAHPMQPELTKLKALPAHNRSHRQGTLRKFREPGPNRRAWMGAIYVA